MPIYAYRCESCGFSQDMLRKLSDPPLTQCPQCGRDTFKKQLTAAGFQLKGSGWYVTDFRDGAKKTAAKPESAESSDSGEAPAPAAKPEAAPSGAAPADASGGAKSTPDTGKAAAAPAKPGGNTSSGSASGGTSGTGGTSGGSGGSAGSSGKKGGSGSAAS